MEILVEELKNVKEGKRVLFIGLIKEVHGKMVIFQGDQEVEVYLEGEVKKVEKWKPVLIVGVKLKGSVVKAELALTLENLDYNLYRKVLKMEKDVLSRVEGGNNVQFHGG